MKISLFEQYIQQGKDALREGESQKAMNFFGNALEIIPQKNQLELIETLFLLGVSMKRLGQIDHAQQCWRTGMMLFSDRDTLEERELFLSEEDELFRKLHMKRYLASRKHFAFKNRAEKDYVVDLINDAWMRLTASGILNDIDFEERLLLYFDTKIVFPTITPR